MTDAGRLVGLVTPESVNQYLVTTAYQAPAAGLRGGGRLERGGGHDGGTDGYFAPTGGATKAVRGQVIAVSDQERQAWLGLAWGAELGPAGFDRLLHAYGSAVAALQAPETELVYGEARLKAGQAALIAGLGDTLGVLTSSRRGSWRRAASAFFLSPDPGYPTPFRELPHPPPVVSVRGRAVAHTTTWRWRSSGRGPRLTTARTWPVTWRRPPSPTTSA